MKHIFCSAPANILIFYVAKEFLFLGQAKITSIRIFPMCSRAQIAVKPNQANPYSITTQPSIPITIFKEDHILIPTAINPPVKPIKPTPQRPKKIGPPQVQPVRPVYGTAA